MLFVCLCVVSANVAPFLVECDFNGLPVHGITVVHHHDELAVRDVSNDVISVLTLGAVKIDYYYWLAFTIMLCGICSFF